MFKVLVGKEVEFCNDAASRITQANKARLMAELSLEKSDKRIKELEDIVKTWQKEACDLEDALTDNIKKHEFEISKITQQAELDQEKALNVLRASMQQALMESDLDRTKAEARLEVYEQMDTKADRNQINSMLNILIEKIGSQKCSDLHVVK